MFRPRSLIALGVGLTLALAAISCGSSDLPTADPSTRSVVSPNSNLELLDPAKGLLGTGLLACRVEPYQVTTKTIGPAGGRIEVGRHVLVIPAGALSASLTGLQLNGSLGTTPCLTIVELAPRFNGRHSR